MDQFVDGVKVHPDMNNRVHGPHADVLTRIPGGTDQVRVSPQGEVLDGQTRIGGSPPMKW